MSIEQPIIKQTYEETITSSSLMDNWIYDGIAEREQRQGKTEGSVESVDGGQSEL